MRSKRIRQKKARLGFEVCVAHLHERIGSEILRSGCYPLSHAAVKCVLVDLHRRVLPAPGEAVAHGFHVEPAMFQLCFVITCMFHGEARKRERERQSEKESC